MEVALGTLVAGIAFMGLILPIPRIVTTLFLAACIGALFVIIAEARIEVALAFFFFALGLPVLNAIVDTVSWSATRFFVKRSITASIPILVLDIVLDICVALICLVLLTGGLALAFETKNFLFPQVVATDWRQMGRDAIQDPFGEGLFVTGMLVTTIIPTFIHLSAGFATAFAAMRPSEQRFIVARNLEKEPSNEKNRSEAVRYIRWINLWLIPAGVLVSAFLYFLMFVMNYALGGIGEGLSLVAEFLTGTSY